MVELSRFASTRATGVGEILQLLRDGTPRTRSEIVDITGLSRSTVSARIDTLIGLGLVGPAGEAASSGGRPPARIAFLPSSRIVLAIDLGATHGTVGLTDLAGTLLDHTTAELDIATGPDAVLDWATDTGLELLRRSGRSLDDLIGVGVGVPGPVEHSTGRPVNPPIMPGWDRFDVPAHLGRAFDVPVLVDNDVNILALGEHATAWPSAADLVFVKVSTGIGAGVVAGGVLQRGAQGSAGDLGHVHVPWHPGSTRPADDDRDLEGIASGPAIAALLRERGIDARTSADVVALVRQGNRDALDLVREAGREIGAVLASVVNLLNPSVIVVGGSVSRAGEQLIAGVRETVYRRSIPLATQHLSIVQSRSDETAGVTGAAILVIQAALSPADTWDLARPPTTTQNPPHTGGHR
jgi:predicted NBD/HSP70 family sugar kinase